MKSAKTIVIAAVVFAALCLSVHSAERDETAPAKVVPTTPARVTPPRTPARPAPTLEEEAPIPKPPVPIPNQASRPVLITTPRTPSRRPPTRTLSPTTPTRPSAITRATPRRRPVRPAQDPHKDSVILVEAFMVEVKLSALRSLDVPAISEGCKSVSAEHIIKLMKTTDAAVVTAGAKVAVGQKSKSETQSSTRQSILSGPPEKMRREYVDVGTQFMAAAEVRRDDKIFAEMEFEYSDVIKEDKKADAIGLIVERKWMSSVTLQDGKPTLVGATQEKDQAVFLIVTANIKE